MPQKGEDHRSNNMTTENKERGRGNEGDKKREIKRERERLNEQRGNEEQQEVVGEEEEGRGDNLSIKRTTPKTSNHVTIKWSSPTHKKTQSHRDAHTGSGRLTRPPAH